MDPDQCDCVCQLGAKILIWIIAIAALVLYLVLPFLMFESVVQIFRGVFDRD